MLNLSPSLRDTKIVECIAQIATGDVDRRHELRSHYNQAGIRMGRLLPQHEFRVVRPCELVNQDIDGSGHHRCGNDGFEMTPEIGVQHFHYVNDADIVFMVAQYYVAATGGITWWWLHSVLRLVRLETPKARRREA